MTEPSMPRPVPRRRGLVALALIITAVAGGGVLVTRQRLTPLNLRDSVVSEDGRIRCSATAPSPNVPVGADAGIRFSLENVSASDVEYVSSFSQVVVSDARGRVLWDNDASLPTRFRPGAKGGLIPGGRTSWPAPEVPLRWTGRLRFALSCGVTGIATRMHLALDVVAPGAAPTPVDAVGRALARTGGLFDRCPMRGDGTRSRGSLAPPGSGSLVRLVATPPPPMTGTCYAIVERYRGFDLVTFVFVTPPDARVSIPKYFWNFPLPRLMEVVVWRFVVTRDTVREVEGLRSRFRTNGPSRAEVVEYKFEQGSWALVGTSTACPEAGGSPAIAFLSRCRFD